MPLSRPEEAARDADAPASETALIELVALKRSGHHAFIDWLCGWKPRPTLFVNNVHPSDPPRLGKLTVYGQENLTAQDLAVLKSCAGQPLIQKKYDVILNFEGKWSGNINKFNRNIAPLCGSRNIYVVLFLRDPLNNFSSLAKRVSPKNFSGYWKFYSQALRFADYVEDLKLAGERALFHDVVLFSAWQRDAQYRRMLAAKYGLTGADLQSFVSKFGGGSSFSGMALDPVKEQEALFCRWLEMRTDPSFLSLFLNDRLFQAVEAYYDLFGEAEPVKKSIIYELRKEACEEPQAARLRRIWLDSFASAHSLINGAEGESNSALRRLRRGYLKSRIVFRKLMQADFFA